MRKLLYALIVIVLFLGRVYGEKLFSFSQLPIPLVPGEIVRITERIPETPYQNQSTQRFKIRGITIIAPKYPSYSYGDIVQIEGELKRNASSSTNSLLQIRSENLVLIYPRISVLNSLELKSFPQESVWFRAKRLIIKMRNKVVGLFRQGLPEPHASLLVGMVVGERANMPQSFHKSLRNTGTVHVIAVSGMNISIVGGALVQLLTRFLSRRKAVVVAVIGIFAYAALAGLSAPVVRAAIMGTIAFAALILGREKDAKRALLITAGLMILWDPNYLFDIGWQLSFLATAGILWGQPLAKSWLGGLERLGKLGRWIGDEMGVVMAAYVVTLPLLLFHFGTLSWIAPVANLMIAPVVWVITIFGGVVAIAGLVWVDLGRLVLWLTWPFLEYMVRVVEWLGRYEVVDVGKISMWVLTLSYGIILCLYWQLKKRSDKQSKVARGLVD